MGEVQLFQRRELPPRRVGQAKPGFDLAEGAELAQAGQALATFAGARFDKLVNSMAANEIAEFQGMVNTEIENFSTFVKSKPGAPFEELEDERNKMIQRLEAISAKAVTEPGRQAIKNFMLNNKNLIFAKTQNNMVAIRTRQTLQASELHIKNFMTSGDIDGLEKHYENMVSTGFYTKEFATARFAAEEAIMLDAAKKLLKVNLEAKMFQVAAASGYEAAEAELRDPATTAKLIESGISRDDIKSLLTDVSERLRHEKVVSDEKRDVQREADRGKIYDAINAGEVTLPDGSTSTDIRTFIEQSSLDEDEQEAMWQKSIKETERKLHGEDIITNTRARSQFYKEIPLMLSGAVSRDDLLARANFARFGDYSDPQNPVEPTLNEKDYKPLVTAINAQYEQGYGQMMSKVNIYAEGILLKTDSLGFVANAPVRYKHLGDFQQAWFDLVAAKGDTLKIADIYPEGRRLAATFQISDAEAQRQEEVIETRLKQREGADEELAKALREDRQDPLDRAIAVGKKITQRVRMVNKKGAIFQVAQSKVAEQEAKGWKKVGAKKKLTVEIARRYLQITGGDREEAKRLAAEDGYEE